MVIAPPASLLYPLLFSYFGIFWVNFHTVTIHFYSYHLFLSPPAIVIQYYPIIIHMYGYCTSNQVCFSWLKWLQAETLRPVTSLATHASPLASPQRPGRWVAGFHEGNGPLIWEKSSKKGKMFQRKRSFICGKMRERNVSTCGENRSSMIIVSIVNDLFTDYTKGLKPKWGFFQPSIFCMAKKWEWGLLGEVDS